MEKDRRGLSLVGGLIGLALILIGFVFLLGVVTAFVPIGGYMFPLVVQWYLQLGAALGTIILGGFIALFL